jgi:hypothetical protein
VRKHIGGCDISSCSCSYLPCNLVQFGGYLCRHSVLVDGCLFSTKQNSEIMTSALIMIRGWSPFIFDGSLAFQIKTNQQPSKRPACFFCHSLLKPLGFFPSIIIRFFKLSVSIVLVLAYYPIQHIVFPSNFLSFVPSFFILSASYQL